MSDSEREQPGAPAKAAPPAKAPSIGGAAATSPGGAAASPAGSPATAGSPAAGARDAGPPEVDGSTSSLKARWARLWPWVAGIVGAVVVAYAVGRIQGMIAVKAAQTEAAAQVEAAQAERDAVAAERAAAERRLALLGARRTLDRAARAVAEHNYGLAQERVKEAAAELAKHDGYGDLARDLAGMNLLAPGEGERLAGELRAAIDAFDLNWSKTEGGG